MRAVGQRISGDLLIQGNQSGLILHEFKPSPSSSKLLILRYAFVTRGPGGGDHIFPAFIIDDWGREIHSMKLYRWVRENGEQFPRGEIFGYEKDDRETQCFLRELELYARLPCYAFQSNEKSIADGYLVKAILLPDESITEPKKTAIPSEIKRPLRSSRVTWWGIPKAKDDIDLKQLDLQTDPGY